jgi:hypothetical protein
MPDSLVPKVELTAKDHVELTIQVAGYEEGKYVDVYGYVTQDNGVYVPFRVSREIPKAESNGTAKLKVLLPQQELQWDTTQPMTVITWVSEVWPSMLTVDPPSGNGKTVWTLNTAADAVARESMAKLAGRPW